MNSHGKLDLGENHMNLYRQIMVNSFVILIHPFTSILLPSFYYILIVFLPFYTDFYPVCRNAAHKYEMPLSGPSKDLFSPLSR